VERSRHNYYHNYHFPGHVQSLHNKELSEIMYRVKVKVEEYTTMMKVKFMLLTLSV
jgi:hypothetical protein